VPVTRIDLPVRPTTAREARDWFKTLTGSWADEAARDTAALLLSEVVTNAVRHARGETINITVTLTPGHLLTAVHDESSSPPIRRRAHGLAGGWGLELMELLSHRWGVDQDPGDGKTVWFELVDPDHDR
jgi:anti-sigma regulatory factor (Ser/Thr protein kinase)